MPIDPADHLALLELHARYAHTLDDADARGWSECFTPDGVLWSNRPVEVIGRAALEPFGQARIDGLTDPERHVSWNHVFEAADDGCAGRCSAAMLRTGADGVTVLFSATYRDRFVRDSGTGGWLIARREVHYDKAGVVPH